MVSAVVDQLVDREVLPSIVCRVFLPLYLFGAIVALIVGHLSILWPDTT